MQYLAWRTDRGTAAYIVTSRHPIITMIHFVSFIFLSSFLLLSHFLSRLRSPAPIQDADDGVSSSSRVAALCLVDVGGLS